MQKKLEQIKDLKIHLQALKAQLAAKESELKRVQQEVEKAKLDRRDTNAETSLAQLLKKEFKEDFTVEVDPEEGVTAKVWPQNNISPNLSKILGAMTDNTVVIKKENPWFTPFAFSITFPYSKLKSVFEGLELSQGVDVSDEIDLDQDIDQLTPTC